MPTDSSVTSGSDLDLDEVRAGIAEVMTPGHFFASRSLRLAWQHLAAEELHWEIFHGRLLDATQTRQRQVFESWNIHLVEGDSLSAEPLLSLKLDREQRRVYVTRGIYSHVWEAYDSGDNVILSRPAQKWVRELTAEVELARCQDRTGLREQLAWRLRQAIVGVSRLPLTSVEAPLPAFSLGELAYFPRFQDRAVASEPMHSWLELLKRGLHEGATPDERARLLECLLRSTPVGELPAAAEEFAVRWVRFQLSENELTALLLRVFNEAALSPYTNFVDQALAFARCLEARRTLSAAAHADFLGRLLCLVARHLIAFDLVKFHHRGANYPDALLLDAVLRALQELVERQADLFFDAPKDTEAQAAAKRRRRRGFRQGWLMRCRYQGHPVPEVPTSPGENSRVLPATFPHIADEQILDPALRDRKLFAGEPFAEHLTERGRAILKQSIADLQFPLELRELGTALYLDRPLGIYKRPTEPDRTPLLSYVAFSRSVAERQLQEIDRLGLFDAGELTTTRQRLLTLAVDGLALQLSPGAARPGVPSLRDAFQTAADFVLLSTTDRSVREFWQILDMKCMQERCRLDWLQPGQRVLIAGGGTVAGTKPGTLLICDAELRPRLEFEFEPQDGYLQSLAGESPAQGLLLARRWEPDDAGVMCEADVRSLNLRLLPR